MCSGCRAGGGPAGGGGGNAGGGMVIIKGGGTVTVAGNIYSRGGSGGGGGGGGNGSNRIWCYDGAGGGGGGGADGAAGGSVLIYGDAVTLGTSLVVATAGSGGSGGSGGNPGTPASSNAKGGGSGGSGSTGSTGKTAVFYETSKSGSSSPGDGGTQQDLNDGTGTITSTTVDYDDCSGASTWDEITWNDTETNGSITYQVEYDTDGDGGGDTWALIPDGALSNNSTGFGTSGVDISGLNTTTYNRIRLKATLAYSGGSPSLNDWTVAWITNAAPSTPTTALLFDNQKAGTTTPAFKFTGTDPDSDNLDYQITWDDDINFGSATTKSSSDYPTDAGWTAATFTSATQVTYTVQAGDALTNGTTYWWKVRTRDPGGLNTWSGWTTAISFTIDTSLTAAAAWHQTTKEQFDNDTAAGTVAPQDGTDDVRMTGP